MVGLVAREEPDKISPKLEGARESITDAQDQPLRVTKGAASGRPVP